MDVQCIQAASNTKSLDVGANIFIGNLDPEIDEKLLYDIFSAFGVILQTPKVWCGCAHQVPPEPIN
jgi:RNA recognition motif-containing protein